MSETTNPALGEVIAAKRKQMRMSQRELAKEVGLNNATISRLESDSRMAADSRTLRLISNALKLDYNYLLSLNNTIDDDPDLRVIARASKKMSADDKARMMELLRSEFDDAFEDADGDGFDSEDL